MFRGYPAVKVAPPAADINLKFEETDPSGCVLARTPYEIADVEVDLHVALRIAKHATDMQRSADGGNIYGVQIGQSVEITNAAPRLFVNVPRVAAREDYEKAKREAETLSHKTTAAFNNMMERNHLDTNRIGFYTICDAYHLYSESNIRALEELVDNNSPAVMLCFDKTRTALGRLHLRAFVLTTSYIAYHRQQLSELAKGMPDVQTRRKLRLCGVYENGIFREIPVKIRCSTEQQMLMADSIATPELPRIADGVEARITYNTNLMNSYSRGVHNLNKSLEKHGKDIYGKIKTRDYQRESGNTVVADIEEKDINNVDINTLLSLASLTEQAEHIQATCDSILMNLTVAKKL